MPKNFERCVAQGGRVRTLKLSSAKYMHICYLNGKSYHGEVKTKQPLSATPKSKKQKWNPYKAKWQ